MKKPTISNAGAGAEMVLFLNISNLHPLSIISNVLKGNASLGGIYSGLGALKSELGLRPSPLPPCQCGDGLVPATEKDPSSDIHPFAFVSNLERKGP